MKKIALLGLGAVLALSANAQFTSGGAAEESSNNSNRTSLAEQMTGKSRNGLTAATPSANSGEYSGRVNLGYNMWGTNPSQGDGVTYNGVYFEWIDAVSVSSTAPLYFDWGLNLSYNHRSDDSNDVKVTSNLFQFAVPLQVEYRLPIGENIHLSPFLGLVARVNILGNGSSEYQTKEWVSGTKYTSGHYVTKTQKNDIDYFSKDDMGSSEACWKRFQLGWNIGFNFDINKFSIGLSYGTDFMEISKKVHSSTFKVGIGVNY